MPRIRTIQFVVTRQRDEKPEVVNTTVEYSNGNKVFYIPIPEYLVTYASTNPEFEKKVRRFGSGDKIKVCVYGESESVAVENTKGLIDSFVNNTAKERKVIFYKMIGTSPDMPRMGYRSTVKSPDFSWSTCDRLEFEFIVAIEVDILGKKSYFESEEDERINKISHNIETNWAMTDFSEEAHGFFKNMDASFRALIEKFSIYAGTKENVQQLIESKMHLLPSAE